MTGSGDRKKLKPEGFVLCGGASRRMGSDKSLLPHPDGGTLLDRAAELTATLCAGVSLLSGTGDRYPGLGLREIADPAPGLGPLAGVAAALAAARGRPVLIVPVDLPALQPAHLQHMIDAFWRSRPELAVAVDSRRRLSVLGIWDSAAAGKIEAAIGAGRLSLNELAQTLTVLRVDLPDAALANWNRPEDRDASRD